ncbi:MAG: AtpZ/AtpI family protein [Alphaproteobacteria bacterium]
MREAPPTLDEIAARLRAVQEETPPEGARTGGRGAGPSGIGMAFRISVELVSAVVVGFGVGWFLDDWLGTKPLFMVLLLFFGAAAGVVNVYRVVRGLDASVGLGQAMRRKAGGGP